MKLIAQGESKVVTSSTLNGRAVLLVGCAVD
jgi:hypothetical protein